MTMESSNANEKVPLVFEMTIDELDPGNSTYDHALAIVHIKLNRRSAKFLAAIMMFGCYWIRSGIIGTLARDFYQSLDHVFQLASAYQEYSLLEDQPFQSFSHDWMWERARWRRMHDDEKISSGELGGPIDENDPTAPN